MESDAKAVGTLEKWIKEGTHRVVKFSFCAALPHADLRATGWLDFMLALDRFNETVSTTIKYADSITVNLGRWWVGAMRGGGRACVREGMSGRGCLGGDVWEGVPGRGCLGGGVWEGVSGRGCLGVCVEEGVRRL